MDFQTGKGSTSERRVQPRVRTITACDSLNAKRMPMFNLRVSESTLGPLLDRTASH